MVTGVLSPWLLDIDIETHISTYWHAFIKKEIYINLLVIYRSPSVCQALSYAMEAKEISYSIFPWDISSSWGRETCIMAFDKIIKRRCQGNATKKGP